MKIAPDCTVSGNIGCCLKVSKASDLSSKILENRSWSIIDAFCTRTANRSIRDEKRNVFFTFMIVSVALSSHVHGLPCVTDGLVSYWTFDKSNISGRKVEDVWGDNNAIIKGNPKIVAGQIGEALEFDGSEDYVNLTNLGDFGSQMGSSTFEAWIKVGHQNDWMVLFKVRDKDCMQWEFNIHSGRRLAKDEAAINHHIAFKAPGENACQGFGVLDRPIKVLDGKWHHIVYTNEIVKKDIAAIGKTFRQHNIYVDGEPIK